MNEKKILGISAFYHDSAAAIIIDDKIIAAAQEERFTRKKHDASFPTNAAKYCLEEAGVKLVDVDAIVFYDKPLLKFERLLETYYGFAPKGLTSFVKAIPVWVKEKLLLKKIIRDELKKVGKIDKKTKMLFPEHHLSHAASAFYPSLFEEAAILTIDGVGEWTTTSLGYGKGGEITIVKELKFPHSVGLLYSAFTYFLGFKVNSGEYKLMGLAPYGNPNSEQVKDFTKVIKENLVDIKKDGSVWLNQQYFHYATGLRMIKAKKWEALFGFATRKPEDTIEQYHCNLALAIQIITEDIILLLARELKKVTGARNLCIAGGVALNCVANGKLLKEKIFEKIFIQPAAGDAGGSIGAALAANYIYYNNERKISDSLPDQMSGAYLGPWFGNSEIGKLLTKYNAKSVFYPDFSSITKKTAEYINKGNVVGWFQGRMEFGPRALGARSILADARNTEMQKKLNLKIKYRESFRPFAPSVIAEDIDKYFELTDSSPYMLLVGKVNKNICMNIPGNYYDLDYMQRLYIQRSNFPAITHVDFTARVQSIHKETNPEYYQLLQAFKQITGESVIVNTSFNVRGEPIVCTPEDAYKCFMRTEMDYLVIGNYICKKTEQPELNEDETWQNKYLND